MEDKVELSYYDCLLRKHDLDLLRGSHWLNDALIGFYFEYLQHKHDDSREGKREILFISPELTQLLKLTEPQDYALFLEPLNAKECNYVLFPLNDCESRDAAGGSHWSLLVFSKKEKTSFHLDSCKGVNRKIALQFTNSIMDYFLGSSNTNFVEMPNCPQQDNGYDCGLFALCFAAIILQQVDKVSGVEKCKFDGVRSLVRTKRNELLDLIHGLGATKQT
ncbi:sentrin-specific protease 8-like [Venturia canescens]|uniref:sentrin-specific protease 8-like n=1 Tax=Venturia canescens TaxID=32260 RepID=UPI001C9D64F6|nr:sentrin-specific protease 8-like [Venturia canescens]